MTSLRRAAEPDGLAQAFIIGRDFVAGRPVLPGARRQHLLRPGLHRAARARRPARRRRDGVRLLGEGPGALRRGRVRRRRARAVLEEKPAQPKSNYAVTGLYFYDHQVCDFAASLKPSARGELEITDLNRRYLEAGQLAVEKLGPRLRLARHRHPRVAAAGGNFIETIEQRQGLKIACPEEIAYEQGWIDAEQLLALAAPLAKNGYGHYLRSWCAGMKLIDEVSLADPAGLL
jgi:glucose-1-phosphate thymidylyltransferase